MRCTLDFDPTSEIDVSRARQTLDRLAAPRAAPTADRDEWIKTFIRERGGQVQHVVADMEANRTGHNWSATKYRGLREGWLRQVSRGQYALAEQAN